MKKIAAKSGLDYQRVRSWFKERRRKERSEESCRSDHKQKKMIIMITTVKRRQRSDDFKWTMRTGVQLFFGGGVGVGMCGL